jgi:hypothetical protein
MVQLVDWVGVHILAGNWQGVTDHWPDVPEEEVQQVHTMVRAVSAKRLEGVLSSAAWLDDDIKDAGHSLTDLQDQMMTNGNRRSKHYLIGTNIKERMMDGAGHDSWQMVCETQHQQAVTRDVWRRSSMMSMHSSA